MATLTAVEHTGPVAPSREDEMREALQRQRDALLAEGATSLRARKTALDRLEATILEHQDDICEAISADFGSRSAHETRIAEIFLSVNEIRFIRKHLARWMRPQRAKMNPLFLPARARIQWQPVGVVGIIAPWNYPFNLVVAPLAAALAAGNRVLIKPSEHTPQTSALVARLLGEIFRPEQVAVFTGGIEVGSAFARLPFDHLFYTGSTAVGRIIMRAAAENLTPVTLELGGKSPVIIADDYDLSAAMRSIVPSKLFNAGQTCIAPDYLLVPAHQVGQVVDSAREIVARHYPTLASNPDYTSVINDRHHGRILSLLNDARDQGARLVEINPAGESPEALGRKLPLTLVLDAKPDMAVMQEEIFGPALPVVPYRDLDEAIAFVNARPRPLALYLFSHAGDTQQRVLSSTTSGGVTLNDCLWHFAAESLPFGGTGESGIGHYHGRYGFETFSKQKPIFEQSRVNFAGLMRAPYGRRLDSLLKLLLR